MSRDPSTSIIISGAGGAGAMTAGAILLDAAARAGWYGIMERCYGPQIRGGEALAIVSLSTREVAARAPTDRILVAMDWRNIERFLPDFRLTPDSLVIGDPKMGDIPDKIRALGAREYPVPMTALAREIAGGRANMVALGIVAGLIGLPDECVLCAMDAALGEKADEARTGSLEAFRRGVAAAAGLPPTAALPPAGASRSGRWSITGNEAAAYGAVLGGIRFAAGYPITPATEVLEWLAAALPGLGGALVQAEDELASVGQVIGASFGGIPSMTATSGPGLALMTESIGLAVAAEVPIVVLDVMRGGPSTGIPTRSEQTDLNMAVYGLHGDAPHVVVAPMSVPDCIFTMQWSVHLAESLQTPVIVLSDQSLGQTRTILDAPPEVAFPTRRDVPTSLDGDYRRYRDTESGVSPMTIPGMPGGQYTADGLEHNEKAHPSSAARDHVTQLSKRLRKLTSFDYGVHWADIQGHGDLAILTWGSTYSVVREALSELEGWQSFCRLIGLRLLAPARPADLARALHGASRILVVEQSHGGQFHDYLRAKYDLPGEVRSLRQPGPLPISSATLHEHMTGWN